MAESILSINNLDFTSNGTATLAKLTATASTVTFAGVSGADVKISGVALPSVGTDVANKNYVDSLTVSPGGATTNIQYNNAGVFAGSANLAWDNTAQTITITGKEKLGTSSLSGTPGLGGSQLELAAQTFTDNTGGPTTTNAIFVSIAQPTLAATSATTTTNAATLYIAGQPITGTNQNITNEFSLWVDSGIVMFDEQLFTGGNITSSATMQGLTITDGTGSLNAGYWTSLLGVTSTTITGTTITDGTASLNAGTLSGLVAPTSGSHAANKAYVDSIASGLNWKDPVRLATTGNITLSGEQTIDGVAAIVGNRILVKDQTTPIDNGIYIVAVGAWTRSSDMANGSSAASSAMFVQQGTIWTGSGFVCTNSVGSDIVGTNDLFFVQFTGTGLINAGDALTKTGNTLDVNYDDVTINLTSNNLQVKSGGISATQLASNAVTTVKITDANVTNAKLANSSVTITAGDGLQNGGAVSLGSSVSIAVNSTVLRTTGDQSASGIQSFTNTTQSTNTSTGAVIISGGLGITKDLFSAGRIETSGTIDGATITDGVWSTTSGAFTGIASIATGSLTATGTVQGSTLTDGTASLNIGALSGITTINASGAITGGSIVVGSSTLSSGTLSGLSAPTADNQAANKAYVDSVVTGLQWKDPCEVATISDITLSSAPATIDGVSPTSGVSRILVRTQTNVDENGIYLWNGTGNAMTRTSDMSSGSAQNFATLVEDGATYAGTSWTISGVSPFTINTSDLIWTQFASSGSVNAGDALTKLGNTLNVNYDDTTIGLTSNNLVVKTGGISATQLATNAVSTIKILDANVTNAKLANSSLTITAGDGLQTGGSVSLGGSVTLNVNSTVLRTTGNQAASGIQSFTNTTQSTSSTTGAVIISGGLGIAKDLFSVGRIDTTGIIEGGTLTDGTLSSTAGVVTGAVSIGTGSLTATGTVQGTTLTDGAGFSTNSGTFTSTNGTVSTAFTLSARPPTEVLFATTGGLVTSNSAFTWDGTLLAATTFDTQTITRPLDANLASLWSDGSGNIDIGLNTTGTIQLGLGPTLELTQSSSTLKSELTIQDNFSRKYTPATITTAGDVTYTAIQFFNGLILRDPSGANRVDTTPTAAQLVAIVPNRVVGSSIEVIIRNTSSALSKITLSPGTGVTIANTNNTFTVANGLTSRFLVVFSNIGFGTEAVNIYAAVPKDRIMLQSSFTSPFSGPTTHYAQWGPYVGSNTVVDSTVIGFSGTIVQLVASFSSTSSLTIGVGETIDFSIGTSDTILSTFTPLTGGTNVITWTVADDLTYPSTSSGLLNIPITSSDRLAIRTLETGTVGPSMCEIRCLVTIELD